MESPFITLVLKTIVNEICSELTDIERLVALRADYSLLASQLVCWLEDKPNVVELQGVRKTIKSLKSKLRHKLADKQDLEEVRSDIFVKPILKDT